MLSLLVPGLGHLYAGQPGRAAAVWLATRVATAALLGGAVLLADRVGLALQLAGGIAVWVIAATDAARTARRAADGYRLRWYNRGGVYVGVCAIVAAATLPWHLLLGSGIAEMRRVPTDTMAPALVAGDHVYVVPRLGAAVRRGEIIVYRKWGTGYVKRVVGAAGDTVAMRAGVLSVDQRPVSEPYAVHGGEAEIGDRQFTWQRAFVPDSLRAGYIPTLATWGPIVVPHGAYFMLGDNRGESMDSRYHGFVADSEVLGRPVMIVVSRDPITGHLRWHRFGQRVGP
jgi:signal peptidase I